MNRLKILYQSISQTDPSERNESNSQKKEELKTKSNFKTHTNYQGYTQLYYCSECDIHSKRLIILSPETKDERKISLFKQYLEIKWQQSQIAEMEDFLFIFDIKELYKEFILIYQKEYIQKEVSEQE